ncbi:hypothetical protein [Streptomyces sp. SPB4]|uniref:hypothetical protein n=1 Tax=Streptomyces sp. SPB4 TaxID=2940553 RepID=UPI0024742C5C|nr:hypothetical protein [Streptomyces sp. SPB4]MDH6540825.1 hypothetical protein [Streptomyces sp. SPB4]
MPGRTSVASGRLAAAPGTGARRPQQGSSPILVTALLTAALGLLALLFLLVKGVHLLATRRPALSTSPAGRRAEAAGLCLSAAALLAAVGGLTGLNPAHPVRPCVEALAEQGGGGYRTPDADITVDRTLLPLSVRCEFAGGTHVELVPAWVNPLLALSLAGAAGCAAGSVRAASAARRGAPGGGHPAY